MIRIVHIFKELGRNLWRNPGTALASLLSLTLLFLLFDLFWIAAGTSDQFYRSLLSGIQVEVYVAENVPDSAVVQIGDDLLMLPGVATMEFVSREQARQELTRLVGTDLLVGYDEANPLPRSFLLTIEDDYLTATGLQEIEERASALEATDGVYYSRGWLEKAEETKSIILKLGLVLGILIFSTAVISSANNIRLMTRARAVGFRQMMLLGAGRAFISLPFIIEGFFISGLAAAAGWLTIMYARTRIGFSQIEIVYPLLDETVIFCSAVALLGAVASFLGISRQLRE
ncbi:MAG: permease-like cell division protein FtsX [candidate division Zixibacteria bacterium]|nr:permease-like cell division protein FtsX [candidate division Zixibacteria bacterium]